MSDINFKVIKDFKCKRCGCLNYDKEIFTGDKLLTENSSIIFERYVCRNCDMTFNDLEYNNSNIEEHIVHSNDLLKNKFKHEKETKNER